MDLQKKQVNEWNTFFFLVIYEMWLLRFSSSTFLKLNVEANSFHNKTKGQKTAYRASMLCERLSLYLNYANITQSSFNKKKSSLNNLNLGENT